MSGVIQWIINRLSSHSEEEKIKVFSTYRSNQLLNFGPALVTIKMDRRLS